MSQEHLHIFYAMFATVKIATKFILHYFADLTGFENPIKEYNGKRTGKYKLQDIWLQVDYTCSIYDHCFSEPDDVDNICPDYH